MTDITKLKLMEIANRVPLFKALNSHEKGQVIAINNIVKVIKKGTIFINYGDHNDNFFILLSGSASVYQHDRKIAQVKGGQFVGEVGFICGDARTATVIADTDLVTFCIDRSRFMYLPATLREKIKDRLINGLVDRVEFMNDHIAQLDEIITTYQKNENSPEPTSITAETSESSKTSDNVTPAIKQTESIEDEESNDITVTPDNEVLTHHPKKTKRPTW